MNVYLAEFVGTFILVLLGDGVVANVVLARTKGHGGGWIVIAAGWGFAVYTAVLCVEQFSGAHINPAVTIGLAAAGKFGWSLAPGYILAQMAGGFAGAVCVYAFYKSQYDATDDPGGKLATFCTAPEIRAAPRNFFCEMVATFLLVLAVLLMADPAFTLHDGSAAVEVPVGLGSIGALRVGLIVFAIGLSLGGTTGYAINPARDLGPRLAHALLPIRGKRDSDWSYAPIPVFGPIAGALLAALFACGLAGLCSPAEAAPAEEAFIEEGAGDGVDGVVFLSSGERLRGKVSFTTGKALRVYDLRTRRVYALDPARIDVIRTLVEKESMQEAWTFEEGGSRKKIRLGWSYPVRNYRQEIQLEGGQTVEGHCQAAVLYVETADGERKLVLPRSQKGRRGQTLEDLVYPASIQLGPPSGATAVGASKKDRFARLEGAIDGLQAVTLVDTKTVKGYPGVVRKSGRFEVAGLLPGTYAVFLHKEREITFGMPGKDALAGADRAAIQKRIDGIAEFFEHKRIVAGGGNEAAPWVLLELERKDPTTLPSARGGSYRVRRWEIWALKKTADGWKITSRVFLDRRLLPPTEQSSPPSYRREPRYAEVRLAEGANTLP